MDTLYPHDQNGNPPKKRCSSCPEDQQWHPATPEFFSRRKTSKDGLNNRCKECANKTTRAWRVTPEAHKHEQEYQKRPEVRKQRGVRQKRYRSRPETHADHAAYMKEYHGRPEVRERDQAYNSSPQTRERMRIHQRNHRKRMGYKTRIQAYYARPQVHARMLAHAHTRRARKRNAPGIHTPEQIRDQYNRQRGKCYYCRQKVAWNKRHVDHVVPLSRGGSNDISNLVISCATCNLSKNSKFLHEWEQGGRLL